MTARTCTVDGCTDDHYAKDLCFRHYRRARAHDGDPGPAGAYRRAPGQRRPAAWAARGGIPAEGTIHHP